MRKIVKTAFNQAFGKTMCFLTGAVLGGRGILAGSFGGIGGDHRDRTV